jgi:hypothetical protein
MRKIIIKLLNNKYVIAYHIKLIKEQRYISKVNYMRIYFINY